MIPLHDNNPTQRKPIITVTIIGCCIATFLWELSLPAHQQAQMVQALGVVPAYLFGSSMPATTDFMIPAWMTIFSSMFLHGGWMHLIGNMLYLWIFGNNVEDAMGHTRFIFFYLLCGICAVLANALPDTSSLTPMIGASGAISGVLGAYLLLFPHARVLIIVPLFFVFYSVWWPAWLVLIFWFVWQIASSILYSSVDGGGIAWGAHIGGFAAGALLVIFFKRRHIKLLQG
jgi:membrane associated rhomboid family serine protease